MNLDKMRRQLARAGYVAPKSARFVPPLESVIGGRQVPGPFDLDLNRARRVLAEFNEGLTR